MIFDSSGRAEIQKLKTLNWFLRPRKAARWLKGESGAALQAKWCWNWSVDLRNVSSLHHHSRSPRLIYMSPPVRVSSWVIYYPQRFWGYLRPQATPRLGVDPNYYGNGSESPWPRTHAWDNSDKSSNRLPFLLYFFIVLLYYNHLFTCYRISFTPNLRTEPNFRGLARFPLSGHFNYLRIWVSHAWGKLYMLMSY